MTEVFMIILLGYMTISIGFGVLEYFMDRKRRNRKKVDGIY